MTRNIYKDWPPYKVGIIQTRAARNMTEFRESMLREHELGSPEWFVLGYVASHTDNGGIKVGSIASTLDVHSTYVTGILRRLEAKKLVDVRPDTHDRRARLVTVTEKGASVNQAIDREFIKQSNKWLKEASPAAIQHYLSVLEIMAQESQIESDN